MARTLHIAAAAIIVAMLPSAGAFAAGEKECQEFDVISTGEFRQTQYVDLDESGTNSPGDKLIGFRVLVDSDGNRVGERYFTGLIHEISTDGKDVRRTTEVVNVLQAGAIFTTKQRVAGLDLPSKINGGTGDFTGATGTVKVTRDGTNNVYHFRVNCPAPKAS